MNLLYPVIGVICKFFDLFLNIGIILLAICEGYLAVKSLFKLTGFRERISEFNAFSKPLAKAASTGRF